MLMRLVRTSAIRFEMKARLGIVRWTLMVARLIMIRLLRIVMNRTGVVAITAWADEKTTGVEVLLLQIRVSRVISIVLVLVRMMGALRRTPVGSRALACVKMAFVSVVILFATCRILRAAVVHVRTVMSVMIRERGMLVRIVIIRVIMRTTVCIRRNRAILRASVVGAFRATVMIG
jgi:hypothetical protein